MTDHALEYATVKLAERIDAKYGCLERLLPVVQESIHPPTTDKGTVNSAALELCRTYPQWVIVSWIDGYERQRALAAMNRSNP